jgi:hypothetical protein
LVKNRSGLLHPRGFGSYRYRVKETMGRNRIIKGRNIHVFLGMGRDFPEIWTLPLFTLLIVLF